jgi:hypothetical protein
LFGLDTGATAGASNGAIGAAIAGAGAGAGDGNDACSAVLGAQAAADKIMQAATAD